MRVACNSWVPPFSFQSVASFVLLQLVLSLGATVGLSSQGSLVRREQQAKTGKVHRVLDAEGSFLVGEHSQHKQARHGYGDTPDDGDVDPAGDDATDGVDPASEAGEHGSNAPDMFLFTTGPWGDCKNQCGAGFQTRKPTCRNFWTGAEAADRTACEEERMPKCAKKCDCNQMPCKTMECPEGLSEVIGDDNDDDKVGEKYSVIGCFDKNPADPGVGTKGATSLRDEHCKGWKGEEHCRSGLPFYRMHTDEMTASLCYEFCVSKGLDVFGIVDDAECRCGASINNLVAWNTKTPSGSLLPKRGWAGPQDTPKCDILMFRVSGPLLDGGVPEHLVDINEVDENYVYAVATEKTLPVDGEGEGERTQENSTLPSGLTPGDDGAPDLVALKAMRDKINLVGIDLGKVKQTEKKVGDHPWDRACDPSKPTESCGPRTWSISSKGPIRDTNVPWGEVRKWKDYLHIPYEFQAGLDDTRKNVFRDALTNIVDATCVRFTEFDSALMGGFKMRPALEIGIYAAQGGAGACSALEVGMPLCGAYTAWAGKDWCKNTINMGWCSTSTYVGSVVHEVCHALGMNHEQKRPDAAATFEGKGPYLSVKWENIPSSPTVKWSRQEQFVPAEDDYMGSKDDGKGDAWKGYMEYDFESIMHYPAFMWKQDSHGQWYKLQEFETIPKTQEAVVGQRTGLSRLDIAHLNDIYGCKVESADAPAEHETPAPTPPAPEPAPAPAPTPPAADAEAGEEADDEDGDAEDADGDDAGVVAAGTGGGDDVDH